MKEPIDLFGSRLDTLKQLIEQGASFFGDDHFLQFRLIDDMHPLATQIAFTCNQPHNFAQWVQGQTPTALNADMTTTSEAIALVSQTQQAIQALDPATAMLPKEKHLDFGGGNTVDLTGTEYLIDFLIPNFYFHLVTVYNILRGNGVPIGKANYMAHLLPKLNSVPQ